ncbi:hypothetical protein BV898_11555 [Hypsibius exemplaris]|uniref:Uncharacterized protein n=1 Tax=Hypsibius exemplaris TaxID=2072580 RepID=A0A1W0WG94_HYPEX|nr:hypothetical protein BV898_11555 [Hypsibius exemplaris]
MHYLIPLFCLVGLAFGNDAKRDQTREVSDADIEERDSMPGLSTRVGESCKGTFVPTDGCGDPDCVMYDINPQARCVLVNRTRTGDARWKANFSVQLDKLLLRGRIAAYNIRSFNGRWSDWFIPGYNDILTKFGSGCRMQRIWAMFHDHEFSYIFCQ